MRYVLRWASITAALVFLGFLCTLLVGLWRFNRLEYCTPGSIALCRVPGTR